MKENEKMVNLKSREIHDRLEKLPSKLKNLLDFIWRAVFAARNKNDAKLIKISYD